MKVNMNGKEIIEELIATIEKEINNSSSMRYTDVRYVYHWFNEYKYVLKEKYSI